MTNQHRAIVLAGILVLALGVPHGPARGQGSEFPFGPEIDPFGSAPTVVVEIGAHIGGSIDPYGLTPYGSVRA